MLNQSFGILLCALLGFSCIPLENQTPPDRQTEPSIAEETVDGSAISNSMLAAVNQLRRSGCKCGRKRMPPVPALQWDSKLESAALQHAKDMSQKNFFDHKGSDGSDAGQRASYAGYKWRNIGENIAQGPTSVAEVIQGWQESPGHCLNIMSADFTEIGAVQYGDLWVQVFGRPRN